MTFSSIKNTIEFLIWKTVPIFEKCAKNNSIFPTILLPHVSEGWGKVIFSVCSHLRKGGGGGTPSVDGGSTPSSLGRGGGGYTPSPETEQHSERLLRGEWCASCVHAGGPSCFHNVFKWLTMDSDDPSSVHICKTKPSKTFTEQNSLLMWSNYYLLKVWHSFHPYHMKNARDVTYLPHTEQWCALSGLMALHFSQYLYAAINIQGILFAPTNVSCF